MNTRKKQLSATVFPVVVRMPKKVISALDKTAEKNGRSRSSEIRIRLVESLASEARA